MSPEQGAAEVTAESAPAPVPSDAPAAAPPPRPRRRPNPPGRRRGDDPGNRVIRSRASVITPLQPERRRPIGDGGADGEPQIGCPMLSRTRIGLPFRGDQQVPRCAVGWAVHDEDEVLFCMNTPTRNECWKESPEHLEALIERLRPQIQAELEAEPDADPAQPN